MTIDEVIQAVQTELKGLGKLLGYPAMHKKILQEHDLNVTRDQYYYVIYELWPQKGVIPCQFIQGVEPYLVNSF